MPTLLQQYKRNKGRKYLGSVNKYSTTICGRTMKGKNSHKRKTRPKKKY